MQPSLEIEADITKRLNSNRDIAVNLLKNRTFTNTIIKQEKTWHIASISNTSRFLFVMFKPTNLNHAFDVNNRTPRKAARPSGVTAEMIKAAGEQAVDWLTNICNRIVKEETITESWQMSELVPIYKGKGDVLECSSSRGIKLLEHGMKVAERVLERRLRQAVEIDKRQFGFRPGTGTTDAIFIARQLQERYRGKHREQWWAFVDVERRPLTECQGK